MIPTQSATAIPSQAGQKLRAPDAARFLGLAPATLAKLRCIGGGPVFAKFGRAVVYDRTDLDAWCAQKGKQRSTADTPVSPRI